ncbi:uncharacterized protein EAE98_001097 [Botrytis deweyae]|uniref:Ketoreductase (KR) domain-containing protein n=1 Tax=Botrytis deweyae TaxID=2478750 RepID=A0ABQ7J1J6_9HELO|nr:uncharacterized protein EAE98_001097 [Botrytis deweyae]KAF7938759.1 hypothetical protein EAE98_001097 [Botrytis deweyae]
MTSKITSGYAVITGAGGGIGKNTCLSFAESGASGILLADLSLSSAQSAAQECKSYASNPDCRILSIHVDVTDEQSVQKMVDTAIKEFGRIDYYVHSAGIGTSTPSPLNTLPLSEFDHILSTNMRGTLLCNRAIASAMLLQEPLSYQGRYTARSLGRGCIVNLGSANSVVAFPGKTAYTTAKHAVVGITKSGAVDYAPHGIRINAICPTWVAGPMNTHEAALNPHFEHMVQAVVPLKRVAQPDEVADAIHFLCSPAATYITGATLIIDAGSGLTVRLF